MMNHLKYLTCLTVPDNRPNRCDCLIVLSYAVRNRTDPTVPTKATIDLSHTWWKRFRSARVILSTGDNQGLGIPNAAVMRRYAEKIGIPRTAIIDEGRSLTTYENLLYCREIVRSRRFRYPVLVLYDLHAPRTLAVSRKLGWSGLRWVSATGAGGPAYGIKTLQTHSRLTIAVYEKLAYLYNILKGEV
jgi:uncharacterized SAM-binding protein YcdF (DUF218 family)